MDSLYEAYKHKYEIIKSQLIKEVDQTVSNDHTFIKDFNLDLIEYTVFKWQENYYVLCYGQNDKETPIFLISQKLNQYNNAIKTINYNQSPFMLSSTPCS